MTKKSIGSHFLVRQWIMPMFTIIGRHQMDQSCLLIFGKKMHQLQSKSFLVSNLDYSHTTDRKYFNLGLSRLDCSHHSQEYCNIVVYLCIIPNSILHNKHSQHSLCYTTAKADRILSSTIMPGAINSYQLVANLLLFKKHLD